MRHIPACTADTRKRRQQTEDPRKGLQPIHRLWPHRLSGSAPSPKLISRVVLVPAGDSKSGADSLRHVFRYFSRCRDSFCWSVITTLQLEPLTTSPTGGVLCLTAPLACWCDFAVQHTASIKGKQCQAFPVCLLWSPSQAQDTTLANQNQPLYRLVESGEDCQASVSAHDRRKKVWHPRAQRADFSCAPATMVASLIEISKETATHRLQKRAVQSAQPTKKGQQYCNDHPYLDQEKCNQKRPVGDYDCYSTSFLEVKACWLFCTILDADSLIRRRKGTRKWTEKPQYEKGSALRVIREGVIYSGQDR